jgi:hypothetical protein
MLEDDIDITKCYIASVCRIFGKAINSTALVITPIQKSTRNDFWQAKWVRNSLCACTWHVKMSKCQNVKMEIHVKMELHYHSRQAE